MFFLGLNKLFSRSTPKPVAGRTMRLTKRDITAAYDAAQTTEYNARHWRNADNLSADNANNPLVRQNLRNRSRYEVHEANSIARGIVSTLTNDTIGTGPRLQVLTDNNTVNSQVEAEFARWMRATRLAEKLRTMRTAKTVDGESFGLLKTNRRLALPVKLDLQVIEADQISSPRMWYEDETQIDGMLLDEMGNPIEYHMLHAHPGGPQMGRSSMDFNTIDASQMLHIFRSDRPGQHRGIPEVTTALPLFAMCRDYTLAVLSSAKTAAKFTILLETIASALTEDGNSLDPDVDPFDAVDIDYDMMVALPKGWQAKQMRAEQPTTTYEMFRNAIINEIARCLNMPFNIAAGNSSAYNYASGRLDHQMYFKSIDVERSQWECNVLDRILMAWFDEAMWIRGLLPDGLGMFAELPHTWVWDGREHVDPVKEANAQATKLANKTTTLAAEYAQKGQDWQEEIRQLYKEKAFQKQMEEEYGVTLDGGSAPAIEQQTEEDPEDPEETDDEETEETTEAAAAA